MTGISKFNMDPKLSDDGIEGLMDADKNLLMEDQEAVARFEQHLQVHYEALADWSLLGANLTLEKEAEFGDGAALTAHIKSCFAGMYGAATAFADTRDGVEKQFFIKRFGQAIEHELEMLKKQLGDA